MKVKDAHRTDLKQSTANPMLWQSAVTRAAHALMGLSLALSLIMSMITSSAKAQEPRFKIYSVAEGLSQSAVYDLMQDRDGFLWLATQDGLNRFDGYDFLPFFHNPADSTSLSSDWISSLFEDSEGRIWIGTHGGGLNVLDKQSGSFASFRHDPANSSSLPDDIVTDIIEDGEGSLWISTYGGLARLREDNRTFDVYREDPERGAWLLKNRVLTMTVDPQGRLWIGTDLGGVHAFNPEENTFTHVTLPGAAADRNRTIILSLFADVDESIWVGTGGAGLFRVNSNGENARHIRPQKASLLSNRVLSILRSSDGRLRIGTDGAGIAELDERAGTYGVFSHTPENPESVPNNTINALLEDEAGYFWIGTTGGGAAREFPIDHYATYTRPKINSRHVMALYESASGVMWIGTDSGGLERITTDGVHLATARQNEAQDRIHGIHPGRRNSVWVSSSGGLTQYDLGGSPRQHFTADSEDPQALFDSRVFAVEESRTGDYAWVATWGGLHKFDPNTAQFERFRTIEGDDTSLSNNRVISVLEDTRGRLWVGTFNGGLNRMDPGVDGFQRYAHSDEDNRSISGSIIATIFESADSTIWIGTEAGLNRLDERTDSFTRFTGAEGMPNNTVYGILEDGANNLWMSTNVGLAVLNQDSGTIRTFAVSDGLQSNEFNQGAYYEAPDGALLFGGINGFNRFYPDRLLTSGDARPALTSLSTATESWNPTSLALVEEIELRPGYGSLNVEFTTLDWRNPEGVAFETKLEGVDEAWQRRSSSKRFASWPRLPGGTFELRIRSIAADGVLSPLERSLRVRVIPPLVERAWFRLFMGLVILGSLSVFGYMWHLSRLRQIEQKQREQQEIHQRLMDSRENERLHMAQDLHDGAVQDLYGIRYKIQSGPGAEADDMVQGVISELRSICGELRPPVLAPFGLEKAIRAHVDVFSEREDAPTVHLDLEADGQTIPEDVRLALYRVYQESMNNLMKHAEAARVDVRLKLHAPSVELVIEDDGKGFSLPDSWIELGRKSHFGLLGLSERVIALGAKLEVRTAPGEGTRIQVVVENVHQATTEVV